MALTKAHSCTRLGATESGFRKAIRSPGDPTAILGVACHMVLLPAQVPQDLHGFTVRTDAHLSDVFISGVAEVVDGLL
eukprot:scaffold897_cov402-Prasinococcus_capsulatus_cf.AAC.58